MDDERQVRPGFLPPKAPGGAVPPQFAPPTAPGPPAPAPPAPDRERPVFVAQRTESGPLSPLGLAGTIVGAIALLLLVMTVGFAAPATMMMSIVAVLLGMVARQQIIAKGVGRAGQARAAIWVGAIGIGLAILAWLVLSATGFTQEELLRWLEDTRERLEEERARQDAS